MTAKGKRVMVVDDDAGLRKVMVAALRHEGYEVDEMENGADAAKRICEQRPDLLLLDVMLPGRNGLDLCQDLKKSEKDRDIPVIMMTCLTEKSKLDDGYWKKETGADDFITKPFPVGEMLRRVSHMLE